MDGCKPPGAPASPQWEDLSCGTPRGYGRLITIQQAGHGCHDSWSHDAIHPGRVYGRVTMEAQKLRVRLAVLKSSFDREVFIVETAG